LRPLAGRTLAALALAAITALAACTGQSAQPASTPAGGGRGGRAGGRGGDSGPVPVVTTKAVEKSMPVTIHAPGIVEAISTVQVRSQVTGRLAQVHFAEGQEVNAGEPLFTLDPQPFQVALEQAEAVLARDTAQANNAQSQVERYQNLFQRGLIPRDQYETQQATAAALKATTAADQAAIAAAKLNLQYSKIVAPASGRTGALQAHVGDLVQANGPTPLVVINQMAPIYVTFSVPGKLLDDIRHYQREAPLRVQAQSTGGGEDSVTAEGRVTFIDNSVDSQTGTIKLKATFPNASRVLWPGQFVDTSLLLSTEPHSIVVPSVAVQNGPQGQYVWVVDNQTQAQMHPVTVPRTEGDESIIGSGVNPGDTVVIDGQLRLTPGARVSRATGRSDSAGTQ
jgi:multidrug efflux system membrane fusion protein